MTDPEVEIIGQILRAFAGFDANARGRVLHYVARFHNDMLKREQPKEKPPRKATK